jgi:hypothetical protein
MYVGGMAALAARNYSTLRTLFATPVRADDLRRMGGNEQPLVLPAVKAISHIGEQFKRLPGHERHYVPRSEYLFKLVQPSLEDALFLGRTYEPIFDRFEVLLALVFADFREPKPRGDVWGPPGRFAWKHTRPDHTRRGGIDMIEEAKLEGRSWPPLSVGLFGGNADRFIELANGYKKLISQFGWR